MNKLRLEEILDGFKDTSIAVVGDLFLDEFLHIDPNLMENSYFKEGNIVLQATGLHHSPGVLGTVASNMKNLGVGKIYAVSVVGKDGAGFDAIGDLAAQGIDTSLVNTHAKMFTPTYFFTQGAPHKIERIDLKARRPYHEEIETKFLSNLEKCVDAVDAVVVADQSEPAYCGLVTQRVRGALTSLAASNPNKIFYADSRSNIGLFRGLMKKPSQYEANSAVSGIFDSTRMHEIAMEDCIKNGREIYNLDKKPVFMTLGERGALVFTELGHEYVPAVKIRVVDVTGAGDSATAGIVPSLCYGASPIEAAYIGMLAAAVTVGKTGTGTANREEILKVYEAGNI